MTITLNGLNWTWRNGYWRSDNIDCETFILTAAEMEERTR